MSTGAVAAIPVDRSTGLFRWNAVLAVLHFVQFVAILALSFAKSPVVTSPVVGTYLRFDEAPATSSLPSARSGICRSARPSPCSS